MGGLETLPIFLIVFMVSGSIHEFAHAWTAWKLGDDTAERQGRLTLDPRVHVDPMGLLMLGISSIAGFGIGWMRPVPVSPWALRNPRRDLMWISAAGPISNMLQALVLVLAASVLRVPMWTDTPISLFFTIAISLNVVLAAFNLIPLKPLDGFSVMTGLLPERASLRYEDWVGRYGMLVLIALLVIPGALALVIGPIYMAVFFVISRLSQFLTGQL